MKQWLKLDSWWHFLYWAANFPHITQWVQIRWRHLGQQPIKALWLAINNEKKEQIIHVNLCNTLIHDCTQNIQVNQTLSDYWFMYTIYYIRTCIQTFHMQFLASKWKNSNQNIWSQYINKKKICTEISTIEISSYTIVS